MAISHSMHPHNLTELVADTSYISNGCRMLGTGTRFHCAPCDFDLHDYCAKCPKTIPPNMNHPHPMNLLDHKPQPHQTNTCKVCNHAIQGLAYQCKDCIYSIHPLCVLHYLGPPHFLHPSHRLTELTANTHYRCNGCKMLGTGTRLRCNPCDFDLHDYCAKCPTWLPCIIYHAHPMILSVRKPGLNQNLGLCHTCRKPVEGLGYECKGCNYWVHPLCCSSQNIGRGCGSSNFNPVSLPDHANRDPGIVRPPMQREIRPAPSSVFTTGLAIVEKIGIAVVTNMITNAITGGHHGDFDHNVDFDHNGYSDHGAIDYIESDFGSSSAC